MSTLKKSQTSREHMDLFLSIDGKHGSSLYMRKTSISSFDELLPTITRFIQSASIGQLGEEVSQLRMNLSLRKP